jgi:hypothetical protein
MKVWNTNEYISFDELCKYDKLYIVYKSYRFLFYVTKYPNYNPTICLDTYILKDEHKCISIEFSDHIFIPNLSNPKSVYIKSIAKIPNIISGTEAVNFALNIIKHINDIQYVSLIDDAVVDGYSLSLFKLLSGKPGFYNKFGFKYYIRLSIKDIDNYIIQMAKEISEYKIDGLLKIVCNFNINYSNDEIKSFNQYLRTIHSILSPYKYFKLGETLNLLSIDNRREFLNIISYVSLMVIDSEYLFGKIGKLINILNKTIMIYKL